MARFERTLTVDHEIGESGSLRIRAVDGRVRLRAVDGASARVVMRYQIRAADEAAADRAMHDADVRVERGAGRLEVDTRGPQWSPLNMLGQLLTGNRVRIDFDAEVPRRASVQVESVSSDVSGEGLAGSQRYQTVSGEIRLVNAAGSIDADSVSGRIGAFGTAALSVRAHSISGRIQAAAARLRRIEIGTTSGGVDLAGALEPGIQHRVESVSGSVRLATDSGVTVELRSISGPLHCSVPHEGHRVDGGYRVVVGDGRAGIRVRSMSGGVDVTSLGGRQASAYGETPYGEAPTRPVPSAAGADPAADAADLQILRALERGEIGVDEAATRLATAAAGSGGSRASASEGARDA